MRLKSVLIKNFKTLEDISIEFNGFYTAISGKNNAGKTNLIEVLRKIFKDQLKESFFLTKDSDLRYQEAKTQWVSGTPDIELHYQILIEQENDPGLYEFIEKITATTIENSKIDLKISLIINYKNEIKKECLVNSLKVSPYATEEIFQKFENSNLAFVHDSAARDTAFLYSRMQYAHEIIFTQKEKQLLLEEQKKLQNKVKSLSKAHKSELSDLLGHLEDKYEVEFSVPNIYTGSLPFSINLKDKNVDVPLDSWGSGTKNRTHILMSILQAKRIQSRDDPNRITPFVMIEEPESFLHPSSQAEFGRVLRKLSNDLQIQIIVTTHSPYMLSQDDIQCNILLNRKIIRGKSKQTEKVEINETNWMAPFSSILGLDNSEFESWKTVLSSKNKSVLLVEGDMDKKYLEHINSLKIDKFTLPSNLEIVSYGGKDALRNAILLKFITQKFEKVLITFDLDAKQDLEKFMRQCGLTENENYICIGINKPGHDCIEGLIHDSIRSTVFKNNSDLIMQLTSQDTNQRKEAKTSLKQKIFDQFISSNVSKDELKNFQPLFKAINNILA